MARPAVAVLSTENLLHNVCEIKKKVYPSKIIAMVKANAYGHGLRSVSLRIADHVDMLGVACIEEALALRKVGVTVPILLAEGIFDLKELRHVCRENFHVVVHSELQLQWLNAELLTGPLNVWIKVDTGMGRLGFTPLRAREVYSLLRQDSLVHVVGMLSHLACADEPNHPLNYSQIENFEKTIKNLDGKFSLCNSGGILHFPEHYYHYVRPGLMLYGISPCPQKDLFLKPVMTVQSSLNAIKTISKGDTIGYGARYYCSSDMIIGIVAIGYGDGYPFSAKNGTPVQIRQMQCPLVGRVSMDMLAIDLTKCPEAQIGDKVILWGDGLPLEEIAPYTHSIPYDIVANVQHRVRFIW
jgi:alanine racemase